MLEGFFFWVCVLKIKIKIIILSKKKKQYIKINKKDKIITPG